MDHVKITSNIDWKEVGITAGIVLLVGIPAALAAMYIKQAIDKSIASKKEKNAKKTGG